MIFKTFNSDINKWTSKIGVLGKSFNAIFDAKNQRKIDIDDLVLYQGIPLSKAKKQVGNLWSYLFPKKEDIQNQLIDIMPEINANDISATTEEIKAMASSVSKNKITWQEWFNILPDGKKYLAQLGQQMEGQIITTEEVAKTNQQARASALAHNGAIKAQTFSAKAGKVALQALAMAGNMIAMWGISELVKGLYDLATATDRFADSASDIGSTLSCTTTDMSSYKKETQELWKTINDQSSSIEDTTAARQRLVEIQDELLDKYGDEKDAIKLVTDAVKENTTAFDDFSFSQYQEAMNQLISDNSGFWDKLAYSATGNDSVKESMISTMEKYLAYDNDHLFENIKKQLGSDLFDQILNANDVQQVAGAITGNIDNVTTAVSQLQDALAMNKSSMDDSIFEKLNQGLALQSTQASELANKYSELYNQYILYEKILTDSSENGYAESLNEITEAYKKYQKVAIKGDSDKIEQSFNDYATILQNSLNSTLTDPENGEVVAKYFREMFPTLQEEFSKWQFKIDFDVENGGIKEEVEAYAKEFSNSSDIISFDTRISNTDEQISAYNSLIDIARKYHMEIDQLVSIMEEFGLVASRKKENLIATLSGNEQNLIVEDWVKSLTDEEASIANSTAFDEALERQKKGLDGAALSAENYSAALEEVKAQQDNMGNETGISPLSISQTVDQLNTQFKPAFNSLQSAYQDIFTDDGKFALNSIDILSTCDSIKSKLDEMSDPEGLNLDVDYSAFEDFVQILNNTESTEQDVENAFDSFATSITQAALSGTEDFETMKAALEDLGVVNDEMVAFDALASNPEMLKQALDEANASMDDFIINAEDGSVKATEAGQAFLEEKVGAENYTEALNILAFSKELYNLQEMNTAGEVANLLTLAENAGYTGEVIEHLTELEQIYQQIASGTLTPGQLDAKLARAEELRTLIKESAGKINYEPKVDFKGAGGKKSAGTAGKEAADTYLEAFEKELKDLDDLKSNGKISEKQYLDALRRLYVKYFNQKKKYLKEYEKYEHQYLEGMKSLYESAFSYITKQIDKRIDAVNSQKDAAISALEAERDARLEAIEAQKEQYEHEIEGIEAQIEAREKEIKAMQDANGERKRAIDLQKAEYELQRMQNQKTSFVYKDGQMVYEADTSGIRDAKQEVEDAKLEIDISKIEKEIDRLEEEKDLLQERIDRLDKEAEQVNQYYDQLIAQTEKHYDAMVKGLEDYKSQFEALTDLLENAQLEASLSELGINMDALLSGSQEEFEKLKTAYIGILADMSRGNDGVLEQLSRLSGISTESISYLNATKGAFEELGDVTLEGLEESIGGIGESASTLSTSAGEASAAAGNIQESVRNMSQSIAPLNTELGNLKTLIGELIALLNDITFPEIGEEGYAQKLMDMAQAFGEIASKCGEFKNIDFSSIIGSASAPSTDGAAMPGREGMEGAAGTGFLGLASAISEAVSSIDKQMGKLKMALDLGNSYFTGQIDVINEEYIPAWENLRTRLAEIIGVEGGDSEDKEGRGKQEAGSTDGGSASGGKPGSIIDIMQTGGDAVDAKLEDPWLKAFNDFATDGDNSIQTICDKIIDLVTKMAEIIQKKCEAAASALHSLAKTAESSLSAAGGSVSGNPILVSPHAKGTASHAFAEGTGKYKGLAHDEKYALRSEYGQPELTVYPDGTAELTTEPVLGSLPKGTVIFNEEQTKHIMNNKGEELGNTHVEDTVVTRDGRVLLPITPDNKLYRIQQKFEAYFKENKGAFIDPAAAMFKATESMDRVIETISHNNTMHQTMVTIGDIHLHEVQDAHSLSRELLLRFPNMLLQEAKKV